MRIPLFVVVAVGALVPIGIALADIAGQAEARLNPAADETDQRMPTPAHFRNDAVQHIADHVRLWTQISLPWADPCIGSFGACRALLSFAGRGR